MDATIALTLIEALLILLAIAISKAIRLVSPLDYSSKDIVDLNPTVSSAASDLIGAPPATKYDVFLSFRGEDTRDNFSSYLYEALSSHSVHTFMDHKLHKGDNISPVLLKTIQESEISVIVFSEDYASSTWCLDELVHIMKCKDRYRRTVIPIFYKVDPSSIRKQNGRFGDGFAKLKQRFKHDHEKVKQWENALIRSTNLSGWDSKNIRPEAELIKKIVKDILSKLNNKASFHLEGLVGIDHRIQKIEELLSEARIVGICGMGGIGKTTLARAVFHKLEAQFEAFSFVGKVRENLARIGLDELLEKCLRELLKDEDTNTCNLRSTFVKNRLGRKKILLVLDDVDNCIAIEDLMKACGWFGGGSRIIITSRDMQVLKNASAFSTYHVPRLGFHDELHLFSLKAFKQSEPLKGYMELSKSVVVYCKGNPLALVVLGCFLLGRGEKEWESALEKLKQAPPNDDIVGVLKVSFDGLDENQKKMFLDIAFFIKEGVDVDLDLIRGLYGSCGDIDISILNDRSLTSCNPYFGYIEMHDLLRDMGVKIARQQSFSNPKGPVRLRNHRDIYDFFISYKDGIEAVRCVSLDVSETKYIIWRASDFQKMHNLIFLKFYKSDGRKPSKLNIFGDLDYLPEELRFLSWEEYPLPHLPLHFCTENLVVLIMRNSNIRQLGNGNEHFPNLKKMDLSHSKYVRALLDLCHVPKIKEMHLDGCVSLAQIHSSSNVPTGRQVLLAIKDCGPLEINTGGRTSWSASSSGLVTAYKYLHLRALTLSKLRMKVWVCGNIICGVAFKHEEMALEEAAELRRGTQTLASLLPFVIRVEWIKSPIKYGHDFDQHFTCDYDIFFSSFRLSVEERGEGGGERGVVGPSIATQVPTATTTTRMAIVEEELIKEDYGESNKTVVTILTRLVPYSITRWSLLTYLRLKDSDIIMSGNNNAEVASIMRSLMMAISNDHDYYSKRIKPLLHAKHSFHNNNIIIPPSASGDYRFVTRYNLNPKPLYHYPYSLPFNYFICHVSSRSCYLRCLQH